MTKQPNLSQQPQSLNRSPWNSWVVERALAERPRDMTAQQKQQFIIDLAQRLSALREWERYEPRYLASVLYKAAYQEVAKLEGHGDVVRSLHALADGRIITGSDDHQIRVWREDGEKGWSSEVLDGHTNWVGAVRELPDGRIISGSDDGTVRVWGEGRAGKSQDSIFHLLSAVTALQLLPDGSIVTSGISGNIVTMRPTKDGGWSLEEFGGLEPVWGLHVLPDDTIVTAHNNGCVRIRTREAHEECDVGEVKVADGACLAVTGCSDGRILVGCRDGSIQHLALTGGEGFELSQVGNHGEAVFCLQALPDGRIVSGGEGGTIKIWKPISCDRWEHEVLHGHTDAVFALQVLPDGRIVTASGDKTIRIWDGTPVTDGGAS